MRNATKLTEAPTPGTLPQPSPIQLTHEALREAGDLARAVMSLVDMACGELPEACGNSVVPACAYVLGALEDHATDVKRTVREAFSELKRLEGALSDGR